MILSILMFLACGSSPTSDPVQLEVAPPQSMPDLPFPPTDQLSVSDREPLTADLSTYFPQAEVGQGRSYLRWLVRGEVFSGKQVLVEAEVGGDLVVLYQERAGAPRIAMQWTNVEDHGRWVTSTYRSGTEGLLQKMKIPEVHISAQPSRFHNERLKQTVSVTPLGVEEVTVPAGTFQALRVRRSWTNPNQQTTVEDTWWANVGSIARVISTQDSTTAVTTADVLFAIGPASTEEDRVSLFDAANEALKAGPAEPPG